MTKKPETLKGDLAHLPPALTPMTALDHWVLWRWELRKGVWTKPPFVAANPTARAKNNDPTTWRPYTAALAAVLNGGKFDGIGFALLDTPFDVVDLDHCLDPATGQPDTWAQIWLEEADGAYVERTPSGEGLRIIGGAGSSEKLHRKWPIGDAREKAAIEIYRNCERYVTVTGAQVGACKELAQVNLLEKIRTHYDNHQSRRRNGSSGRGFDFNDAGTSVGYDEIVRNGAPEGKRSELFQACVWHLAAKRMSVEEIVAELMRYPNGIASKYISDNRLRAEAERSHGKWANNHTVPPTTDDQEPDEPAVWDTMDKTGNPKPT